MKKHIFLGVKNGKKCCILNCLLPFDELNKNIDELESSDFEHESTDWCGCDDIERTLKIRNLTLTDRKLTLNKPITFEGYDSDMDHQYHWHFSINEIYEVK